MEALWLSVLHLDISALNALDLKGEQTVLHFGIYSYQNEKANKVLY